MADERTVSTTDVVSYLDNGDPDYIFEIVDKTARANITSINTTLGKKRSIFYCDYFKFNNADTTKTKQRYQFIGPYHKMTNGAKTFTAANLIAGDVCFSTEIRAYDGTTVLRRGIFALEYNYKSSSKYYSPAAYTYGAVDFDFTDRLPQATSADAGKVLTVDSSGAWGAANPATELPAVTSSDENSVLAVDSSGTWAVNSDFNSRLDTVESNVSTALNDIEALQYDVDAVESSVENLESTVNTDISNLQDDISALDESVTELNGLTFYMKNATSSDYGKVLVWTEHDEWEVADVPTELPAVTSSDNGKVLKVVSGAWTKAAETKELPTVTTSDAGNVLTVNSSGKWAKAAPPTELPDVTSSDAYKVLAVNSSGAWAADDSYLQGMNSFNTRISALETKVPDVTASDDGVVLRVMNGVWSKSMPDRYQNIDATTGEGSINTGGSYYYDAQRIYPIKRGVRIYNRSGGGLGTIGPNNPLTVTNMPSVSATDGTILNCKLTFTKLNASYVQEGGFSVNCDVKVEKTSSTTNYDTTWIITPYITYENVTFPSIKIFFEYIDYTTNLAT